MERAIGEIFQDCEVTLKVEKEKDFMECIGCYYFGSGICQRIKCIRYERIDKTSVIFVKQ